MNAKNRFFVIFVIFSSLNTYGLTNGGISGGGGFVINPLRPTDIQNPEVIEHVIKNSKPSFYAYVEKKYKDLSAGRLPESERELYNKLFNTNSIDLNLLIQKYEIYVDDKNPCYASDRKPVDGSIYSNLPNSVCISAVSFAEKVNYSEVAKQSVALILHEFSEISGLSEDEAIVLQKKVLLELN